MSLNEIISCLNKRLEPLARAHFSGVLFGLATPVLITKTFDQKDVQQIIPAVTKENGEYTDVSVNDKHSLILYHKMQGLQTAILTRSGYGDGIGDMLLTYSMYMVVYYNQAKVKLLPDEMYLQLAHYMLGRLEDIHPFKLVQVKPQSLTANAMDVFKKEYTNVPYKLKPNDNLISLQYTIEAVMQSNCVQPIC